MGKRILIALGLSLFYCLSVFGNEKETTYQEGACSLDTMAGIVDENEYGNENASISFLQEVQSIAVGESYAELKERAKASAAQENAQPKLQGNRWGIFLTPSEVDLLARIVMLEAGGESPLGQQAVIEVIFNRMVSPYYGGSLEHVLSASGQFSTWKMRYSAQAAPTPQVLASITSVLQGETNILPFQTLYFSRRPQNRHVQVRIGGHAFCNQ